MQPPPALLLGHPEAGDQFQRMKRGLTLLVDETSPSLREKTDVDGLIDMAIGVATCVAYLNNVTFSPGFETSNKLLRIHVQAGPEPDISTAEMQAVFKAMARALL